jgi:hypothetical protein
MGYGGNHIRARADTSWNFSQPAGAALRRDCIAHECAWIIPFFAAGGARSHTAAVNNILNSLKV